MTNSPTPDPHSSSKSPLGFDEFIAILVAFSTIGTIFFWATSRKPETFTLFGTKPPAQVRETPSTNVVPAPDPTVEEKRSPDRVATIRETRSPTTGVLVAPTAIEGPSPTPTAEQPQPGPKAVVAVVKPPAPKTAAPAGKANPPAKKVKFSDVPNNLWAAPFITTLADRGVFRGYTNGTFQPNKSMTRAEFAVRLNRAFNIPAEEAATDFEDVSSKYWAYDSIKEADITGFVEGYPKDYFRPEKPITRTEAIVALASGLDLKIPPNPEQILKKYNDAAQIPKYARAKVAAATQAGVVISSNPELFKPTQAASRAEVAALLYQGLVKRGKAKPINSKAIVKP